VVNGDSYTHSYVQGNGHKDLATQLGIVQSTSLALPGSCNSRVIRTTLKDSYTAEQPTLYVVGLSFLKRNELPVGCDTNFEGRWISFHSDISPSSKIDEYFWSHTDTKRALECFSKFSSYAVSDQLEQLMFSMLAMVTDLVKRNHQVVIFRQPPDNYVKLKVLNDNRFKFLKNCVNIVDGLAWSSLEFLADHDTEYSPTDAHLPKTIRHPLPGEHHQLNKFLIEYMATHNLL
jgi:hypothetical protein